MTALLLTPLELAAGIVFGQDDSAPASLPAPVGHPRDALAAELRGALERPPCVVSFSGGLDSSAMLALAMEVARREGLPGPVPVTLRFPGIASADESAWQQLVIDHLGVREWQVITVHEELDLLGDVAIAVLRAHGLLWPPNAYLHVPILEPARGGSLVNGVDGDGLFGYWRWARAQAVLHRRVPPSRRDVLRVALALSPPRLRRRSPTMRPSLVRWTPWLSPIASHQVAELARDHDAAEPRRWDHRLAFYARERYHRVALGTFSALAAERNVTLVSPLLEPRFLASLARHAGPAGYPNRRSAMRALFGDLLPPALIDRPNKGEFGRAIWRTRARAFAESWNGSGVDLALVDPERLRAAWRASNPLFGSATLLQHAWLESHEAS
jgi:asparagine synthase (glutamine-hydrolysing)